MINHQKIPVETPRFDIPVILTFNALLWVLIILIIVAL